MIHEERTYCVSTIPSAILSPEYELARRLTESTWTLCTGFRLKGFLFLNDSFSEDSAQEYAVIHEETMQQVESITVSWMSASAFAKTFIELLVTAPDDFEFSKAVEVKLDPPGDHTCELCA